MTAAYDTAVERMNAGEARHDAATAAVAAFARLHERGHPGAGRTLELIETDFKRRVTADGTRTPAEADKEWADMISSGDSFINRTAPTSPTFGELDLASRLTVDHTPTTEPQMTGSEPDDDGGPVSLYAPSYIDWQDFWTKDHDTEDFICAPLLAKGRGHALFATAKTGKSLLALEMAAALACGRPFLDQPASDTGIPVMYCDFEMTEADLYERLVTFGYGPDDTHMLTQNLYYNLLPRVPTFDTPLGGATLVQEAVNLAVALVIVDTTTRAVGGEENAAETIRDAYRYAFMPLKEHGITTLRLDHAGKAGREGGQRGSSAKNDDVDIVWYLEEHGTIEGAEQFTLISTHKRVGWIPDEYKLLRDEDTTPLHQPTAIVWPDGVVDKALEFDEAGIPVEMTRAQRRRDYPNVGCKNSLFGWVQKYRKNQRSQYFLDRQEQAGEKRGPAQGPTFQGPNENERGPAKPTRRDPNTGAGHSRGPAQGPDINGDWGPSPPSLGGDGHPATPNESTNDPETDTKPERFF
jgi:hypothetical protein